MHAIIHEIRQALSQLRHSPGFTALAVIILGLGLGVTLYMFTVVKAYMLTPLPYPNAERIMHIEHANPLRGFDSMEVSLHDFVAYRDAQQSFESLAAFYSATLNLSDNELPERFEGAYISPSAFETIKASAHIGRTLREEDAALGAPPVILLGYDAWLNRYNADPGIVGEQVRVNGVESTVIGIMPKGFRFPLQQEAWVPLKINLAQLKRGEGQSVEVFGKLKPGVTLPQARDEFENMAAALASEFPENKDITTLMKPFQDEYVPQEAKTIISAMFVSVLFVLLIACANVANLILARTAARQKDIAVRAALGASRWRILVHVLTESVVLASLGAFIAYFLADFGLEMTDRAFAVANIQEPFWVDFTIDTKVLVFAAFAALISGVIAGLAPALRATRTDINEHLKEGAKGSGASASRLSRSLVIGEIALSCILLVSSGLMIRSVMNISDQPLGIENTNLLTGRVGLPEAQYPDGESQYRFFEQLAERLETNPDVIAATVAYSYPGIGAYTASYATSATADEEERHLPFTTYAGVLDNYAETLGIDIQRGRWFDARDNAQSQPVVVIDQFFAQEAFGNTDPVGQQVQIGAGEGSEADWRTVVGVVNPILLDEIDDPIRARAFIPLSQAPVRFLTVAVHTRGEPLAFSQTLRETVQSLDKDIPVYWVRTLDDWIFAGNFTNRIVSSLFGVFAIIAVALAAAGIYGVLAYTVSQRTREIGVRRALGAEDGRILQMVLGQGMFQLAVGLGIGLLCAVGFARVLSVMLHGVSPFDPVTLLMVAVTLFGVALIASFLPALRAMRVNPMEALRYE